MLRRWLLLGVSACISVAIVAVADQSAPASENSRSAAATNENPAPGAAQQSTAPAAAESAATPHAKLIAPREQLEKAFEESLTGVSLVGVWQMTGEGGLKGEGPLTKPEAEDYVIFSAKKASGDVWIITARIKFGEKDVNIPVPVRVVWAEDTPIITLDDLTMPGLGTYSARVMIFQNFYCGTWFCGQKNYGGVMSGRVVKSASTPPSPAPKKDANP